MAGSVWSEMRGLRRRQPASRPRVQRPRDLSCRRFYHWSPAVVSAKRRIGVEEDKLVWITTDLSRQHMSMSVKPLQHRNMKQVALVITTAWIGITAANAAVSIDTSSATDWKIRNGTLSVDWLPGNGRIFSMHWNAFPNQELIDQTNRDHNGPKGFYMDNVGPGFSTPS